MLTLGSIPASPWPKVMTGWTRLLAHLRKSQPALQYVAVKEEGKVTGMKHLHIIMYNWVWHDYENLVEHWKLLTGAQSVYITRRPSIQAAAYAAKYVGKGGVSAIKIVTYSKLWPQLPSDKVWSVVEWRSDPRFEPAAWNEDSRGRLIASGSKLCEHVTGVEILSLATIHWLRSIQVRSWHPPPDQSET